MKVDVYIIVTVFTIKNVCVPVNMKVIWLDIKLKTEATSDRATIDYFWQGTWFLYHNDLHLGDPLSKKDFFDQLFVYRYVPTKYNWLLRTTYWPVL